jgi:hypothetical protein
MTGTQDDIRAIADAIVRDAITLTAIEAERLALDQDDPRIVELCVEAVAVARRLLNEAKVQRELAFAPAIGAGQQISSDTTPIECPTCGTVEWRRSGTIIVDGATRQGGTRSAEVFAGRTSELVAWTCTCGETLEADDPRSLRLDAMARHREPWIRHGL